MSEPLLLKEAFRKLQIRQHRQRIGVKRKEWETRWVVTLRPGWAEKTHTFIDAAGKPVTSLSYWHWEQPLLRRCRSWDEAWGWAQTYVRESYGRCAWCGDIFLKTFHGQTYCQTSRTTWRGVCDKEGFEVPSIPVPAEFEGPPPEL